MRVVTDVCVRMVFVWEETHLSDLVTTWPSYMPTKVAAVRGERVTNAPARCRNKYKFNFYKQLFYLCQARLVICVSADCVLLYFNSNVNFISNMS